MRNIISFVRKIFLVAISLLAFPVLSHSVWYSGSGPDYSQGAASEFYCSNLAGTAVTTQVGLSKTSPALAIVNPTGNTKNLVILDVGIDITASPAAAAEFMLAYSTGATNSIVYYSTNTMVTSADLYTQVNSTTTQATLMTAKCIGGTGTVLTNTPIAFRYLGGTTGASGIGGVVMTDLTQGKVVVPPGGVVTIQATSAAAVITDILWREDPI